MKKKFNILDYPIAFRQPRRLTDVDFWHAHIPFAFVLMQMVKPRIFVELGTHKGDSYCAFCQAVDELGINTACYAVDTWKGDPQTGFYGDEIYEELFDYNKKHYGAFSTLIRSTFDSAVDYFADGSIDLLHIDGLHTYEAVKHDFTSWLPKVSDKGVILFHDTNVREREFGVWRLWREVRDVYPSFEFSFGCGLGIIAVGKKVAWELKAFLEYGRKHSEAIQQLFYLLGNSIVLDSENSKYKKELARLEEVLKATTEVVEAKEKQLLQADRWLKDLKENLEKKEKQLLQADGWIKEQKKQLSQADKWLKDLNKKLQETEARLKEIERLKAINRSLSRQLEAKEQLLNEIFQSRGWQWLTRVRVLRQKLSRIKDCFKKSPDSQHSYTYHVRTIYPALDQRPRVLHAIANFMMGGSSRLVVDLIEYLGHKYEQEVITFFIPNPPAYDGLKIDEVTDPGKSGQVVSQLIKERDVDIVHVHYWGDCDDPWYRKVFEGTFKSACKVIENINTPVAPFVDTRIDHYVFVSEYARKFTDLSPEPSTVIYPGSDLSLFQRKGFPIPDDTLGLVYRLEPDKLREDSIEVFIEVVKRRPNTTVYVVGDGSLLQPYKTQVKNQGVEKNFRFVGRVPYEKLPDVYRKFSIFVAPVWKESFGQVSCFAMGMKIPVAGYRVGALPEILGGEDCLGKDRDHLAEILVRLLDDRESRIQIGEKNYKRASELFSVEVMIQAYDELYRNLLKK